MPSINPYANASKLKLLQRYPFCWACLQNSRASKLPQNSQHFPTPLPKDNEKPQQQGLYTPTCSVSAPLLCCIQYWVLYHVLDWVLVCCGSVGKLEFLKTARPQRQATCLVNS